jgi:hypothetical protein
MNLYDKPRGVQTRWVSFENPTGGRGMAAQENRGAKGHACDRIAAGETKTLLDFAGSGEIRRIWMTVSDRSPEMLRSLRLDMHWDGAILPAVSCPLGDFFNAPLARPVPFESAFFSNPEGRSFNCCVPMPFRRHARITLTNESPNPLTHVFYDVDLLTGIQHAETMLYFHAHWRRESPNEIGREFTILPSVTGAGRFLGCNMGIVVDSCYSGTWWGEGEIKVWLGDDTLPTLCGTGTEDYIGTAWGQGAYAHRTQGCLAADTPKNHWSLYRFHLDDPVYFDDGCRVTIHTIGCALKKDVLALQATGVLLTAVSVDPNQNGPSGLTPIFHLADRQPPLELSDPQVPDGYCLFWRQDDWSATAYVYLESAEGVLPVLAPLSERIAKLAESENTSVRADV